MLDHRHVPLDVLREFTRSQAAGTTIHDVAADAGVGRSTVQQFISTGRMPQPRTRRLLAFWYLRRVKGVEELELLRPYAETFARLFAGLPGSARESAIMAALEQIALAFTSRGQETPRWTEVMWRRMSAGAPIVVPGSSMPEHREVPLEVLREFARSQAELTSIRRVAEDAEVSRSSLHKFIANDSVPHPRLRRLLALWYIQRVEGADEIELIRPYVSALAHLLAGAPECGRESATLALLENIGRAYRHMGAEVPRWVDAVRRHMDFTLEHLEYVGKGRAGEHDHSTSRLKG